MDTEEDVTDIAEDESVLSQPSNLEVLYEQPFVNQDVSVLMDARLAHSVHEDSSVDDLSDNSRTTGVSVFAEEELHEDSSASSHRGDSFIAYEIFVKDSLCIPVEKGISGLVSKNGPQFTEDTSAKVSGVLETKASECDKVDLYGQTPRERALANEPDYLIETSASDGTNYREVMRDSSGEQVGVVSEGSESHNARFVETSSSLTQGERGQMSDLGGSVCEDEKSIGTLHMSIRGANRDKRLEMLYRKTFGDGGQPSISNTRVPVEQSRHYQIEQLLSRVFPNAPASQYMVELDKLDSAEQEEFFSAVDLLDGDSFHNSSASTNPFSFLSSTGMSSNGSSFAPGGKDWSKTSNRSSSQATQGSYSSVEQELKVTTYNQRGSQVLLCAEQTTQTQSRTSYVSDDVVFIDTDVDEDVATLYSNLSIKEKMSTDAVTQSDVEDCNLVTVVFLMSNGEEYSHEYELFDTAQDMKSDLADIFYIPIENISFMYDGAMLEDEVSLEELGAEPGGTLEMRMYNEEPFLQQVYSDKSIDTIPLAVATILKVKVEQFRGQEKIVVVEIWNQAAEKPWIGGFRDKTTLKVYHHAFSQTPPREVAKRNKMERVTQTTVSRNQSQSTRVDHATQVYHEKAFIPCNKDKIITAKKYVTFAEIYVQQQYKLRKVVTIQRYLRAWLLRRMIKRASEEYRRRVTQDAAIKAKVKEDQMRHRQKELIRKVYPRTRADFETLYNCVEKWRLSEIARINEHKTDSPKRKAELRALLKKEVDLLKAIEEHRVQLKDDKIAKKDLEFMEKSSQPIKWTDSEGKLITMDTVRIQRAREFGQLYLSLCNVDSSTEDRVNLLMSLKHALKIYNARADPKINELLKLMVRECDCLVRGLKRKDLDMLRNRLRILFLEFMHDPDSNPEAAKYTGAVPTATMDTLNMYKCSSCTQFKPQASFDKTTLTKVMRRCKACAWLENIARGRNDLGPYRNIVHALRCDETRRCCNLSVAFMMQEEDFYFLVNNVWHSCSAISESRVLENLLLPRWDVKRDWSPWNCILLNDKETKAHVLLEDLDEAYEAPFVAKVQAKHQLAQNHFERLVNVDQNIRDSGKWYNKANPIIYIPPSPEADAYQ